MIGRAKKMISNRSDLIEFFSKSYGWKIEENDYFNGTDSGEWFQLPPENVGGIEPIYPMDNTAAKEFCQSWEPVLILKLLDKTKNTKINPDKLLIGRNRGTNIFWLKLNKK